jgi:hypothetical protein
MEILLIGSMLCVTALISSAWLMTFAKWFVVKGVDEKIPDYQTLIRAHVDYALMALFGLGFYGIGIELSVIPCWCVAIGGFTNPTVFVIAAFDPDHFWEKTNVKIFTALTFITTTVGFVWLGYEIVMYALDKNPFGL